MATVTFYGFGYNERLCGEIQDKINSNKTISRVKLIDRGFIGLNILDLCAAKVVLNRP